MTPAALPRALRLSPAAVGVILALTAGPGAPGQAQDAGSAPAGEIPTVEGTRDATVPLRREEAGSEATKAPVAPTAMPPAALGTLSSWQKTEDRSAIRIGSEFGADELLGAPLVDREGHAVGTIEDLLIDTDGMVRKAIVRPAPAGSRSAVVDLLQLRKRDEGGGFVADEAPRGMGPLSPLGSQDSPGAAGTKP